MRTRRKFNFPLATLTRSAELLGSTITDPDHRAARTDRLGLTNEKAIAANALYADCLTIKNAASLQYPSGTDPTGNAKNITQRARFLFNEFPPRDRDQSEDTPQGGETPPPAP